MAEHMLHEGEQFATTDRAVLEELRLNRNMGTADTHTSALDVVMANGGWVDESDASATSKNIFGRIRSWVSSLVGSSSNVSQGAAFGDEL